MRKSIIALALAMLMLLPAIPASAAVYVYADNDAAPAPDGIYVAGNDDFYPIERYNAETNRYEGVLPEVLELVSGETGIDFVYIRSGNASRADLAENLQVEMVSSHIIGGESDYAADETVVLSYTDAGETVELGFAFTQIADVEVIEKVKNAVAAIPHAELDGLLISVPVPERKISPMIFLAGAVIGLLLVFIIVQDSVKIRRVRRQSRINEMTDMETGIGNLAYFQYHFGHTISDQARSLYYVAYIMIDSEYLQTYHHESTFSDVVKYTASVLLSFSKHNEIAARITESGFAFAFQATNREDVVQEMEAIIGKLNSYVNDDEKKGKPVFHAAVYNLNSADRSSELILLNLRRNCIRFSGLEKQLVFCDARSMHSVRTEKENVESITRGFDREEFKLYLQFIVDNKSRKIISAEALSRWETPDKGLLTPDKYIDVMEATALISRLDYYMFEMVCRQLEKWKDTRFAQVSLSCNFTRITISEKGFIDRIREVAGKYNFDRNRLLIEITEDAMERNRERAMRNMQECKKMGFRIALDDLGSGYTSLINLCDYPIDVVKIDRNLMLKANDKNGKKLFTGVIALAHSLNLKVVCEGVETLEQRDFVAETDCDYVQGWYYSRVFPVKEAEGFILQYSNRLKLYE